MSFDSGIFLYKKQLYLKLKILTKIIKNKTLIFSILESILEINTTTIKMLQKYRMRLYAKKLVTSAD